MSEGENPFTAAGKSDAGEAKPIWAHPLVVAAVALLALLLAVGALWDSHDTARELQQTVGVKLGQQEGALKDNGARAEQLSKDLRDAQNRIAQLEVRLGEFQTQRVAIEEMYRELARAPDDWLLAEIEQTLNIASRELTLAGNVRAALIALQAADQRLARADKLQVLALRRAITADMERLKAIPLIDAQGISVKLDNLMSLSATLPLSVPDSAAPAERDQRPSSPDDGVMARFGKDMWHEVKQLIRIRRLDSGDVSLLSPQQSYFLRENLKLRLLSARTALIARDETNYKEDLKLAREMLTRYFDIKAKANINALALLRQMADNPVSIAAPDITGSLNAVRAARAARERPARP